MKVTIAILLLGTMLGSVSTCSLSSCTLTGTLTGIDGCTSYKNYIDCLTTQSGTCTSSASDLIDKGLIDAAITTNTILRAALPCGASLASISSIVLILSVVVTLIKIHL
ncbi:uncharacterized protein [Haliotis asinina]|uniref:uncharacterized protein n=1 Tax=Haliotis asinina TaxID=109174 RepID=UPI003531DF02